MAKAPQSAFVTVRSEGGLLPPDLLARIATSDVDLGGVLPVDYGLQKGTRLADAIAQSWAACKMYWPAFKMTIARLGEGETGVTETREQWVLPLFRELGYGRLSYHRPPGEMIDGRSPSPTVQARGRTRHPSTSSPQARTSTGARGGGRSMGCA